LFEKKTKRIGIAGVSRGTGTTFCAMLLASYVSKVRKEHICVVERNMSGSLMSMCGGKAKLRGITVCDCAQKEHICTIIDFGALARDGERFRSFCACDLRLITASLCPWKQEDFYRFAKQWEEEQEVIYLIPFADEAQVKRAGRELHRQVFSVSPESCWYRQGQRNLKLWETLWKNM